VGTKTVADIYRPPFRVRLRAALAAWRGVPPPAAPRRAERVTGLGRSRAAVIQPTGASQGDRNDWLTTAGFQPLSVAQWKTDVDRTDEQQRNQELALDLYYSSSILHGMHRLKTAYTVGSGRIAVHCVDKRTQQIVDMFADDPANTLIREPWVDIMRLRLFGEYAAACGIRRPGIVRLHWFHPYAIRKVVFGDGGNDALPDTVIIEKSVPEKTASGFARTREQLDGKGHIVGKRVVLDAQPDYKAPIGGSVPAAWRAVGLRDLDESWRGHLDMAPFLREQLYDGDVLYYRVNREGNSRGVPDYADVFDDIAKDKQMFGEEMERVSRLKDYLYKYRFVGTPTDELKRKMEEEWEPRPGSVAWLNGTKDECDIEAVTPSLSADETKTFFRLSKGRILQSDNLPPAWFSEDPTSGLSRIDNEEPTIKRFELAQAEAKAFITLGLNGVISTARAHGALEMDADPRFTIELPRLRQDEVSQHVGVIEKVVPLLERAVDAGFLDRRAAAQIFTTLITSEGLTTIEEMQAAAKGKTSVAVPEAKGAAVAGSYNAIALGVGQALAAGLPQGEALKILRNAAVKAELITPEEMARVGGGEPEQSAAMEAFGPAGGKAIDDAVRKAETEWLASEQARQAKLEEIDRLAAMTPGVRVLPEP